VAAANLLSHCQNSDFFASRWACDRFIFGYSLLGRAYPRPAHGKANSKWALVVRDAPLGRGKRLAGTFLGFTFVGLRRDDTILRRKRDRDVVVCDKTLITDTNIPVLYSFLVCLSACLSCQRLGGVGMCLDLHNQRYNARHFVSGNDSGDILRIFFSFALFSLVAFLFRTHPPSTLPPFPQLGKERERERERLSC
jgi:hypothetical protein